MRVLVLGANGFVGRRVVRALATSGWATPIAGVRGAAKNSDVASVTLDATDEAALDRALVGMDAVVNCVAGDADSIVRNAAAVLASAARAHVRVVYLSSMAVYGSATGPVNEDAPLLGDLGPYSTAKVQAEQLAMASPANVTILRPGCIYGSDSPQWTHRIARLLADHRIGDLGPAGDGCSNLVHVDDVVAAILAALRCTRTGVRAYNLAMPNAPDWNGYFLAFARVLGAVPIARIPAWRLKLETKALAIPLKLVEKVAGNALPPPIPPSLLRLWHQNIQLRSDRASSELGISWTPLATGLSEAVAGCSAWRKRVRASS
jgi:nucleoside-diphosphate-sugar epimerase